MYPLSSPAAGPTSNTARKKLTIIRPRTLIASFTTAARSRSAARSSPRISLPATPRGTTTWAVDETENGRVLHVVIVGSPNVNPGYKLVGNKAYPQIAADYKRGFVVLHKLPCDIFLGAHGSYFDLTEKYPRWKAGDKNAFIDPAGYKAYIADREQAFQKELERQSAASRNKSDVDPLRQHCPRPRQRHSPQQENFAPRQTRPT